MNSIQLLKLIEKCGSISGRKRLQKLVFISKEKHNVPFEYNFILHLFGPYSSDLQNDLSFLVDIGFIKEIPPTQEIEPYFYELTDDGRRFCEKKTLDSSTEQQLTDVVAELCNISTEELVHMSYQLFSSK